MLYAIVPTLLRYAINTPCCSAFWHSHPYVFVHFLEMFFITCSSSDRDKNNGDNSSGDALLESDRLQSRHVHCACLCVCAWSSDRCV